MGKKKDKYKQQLLDVLSNIKDDIYNITYNSDDIDDSKINAYNQGFCDAKLQAKYIIRGYIKLGFDIDIAIDE